jgi:hypothetical protein
MNATLVFATQIALSLLSFGLIARWGSTHACGNARCATP